MQMTTSHKKEQNEQLFYSAGFINAFAYSHIINNIIIA